MTISWTVSFGIYSTAPIILWLYEFCWFRQRRNCYWRPALGHLKLVSCKLFYYRHTLLCVPSYILKSLKHHLKVANSSLQKKIFRMTSNLLKATHFSSQQLQSPKRETNTTSTHTTTILFISFSFSDYVFLKKSTCVHLIKISWFSVTKGITIDLSIYERDSPTTFVQSVDHFLPRNHP